MGAKRRKKSKRISLVGESRVKPTAETLKKLKPDPLWQMATELGSERLQAAHEIREAVRIISAPLRIRVQQWERQDRSFTDHESFRAVQVQQKYNAWVDEMSVDKIPVGPALDLIVEGMGNRKIETIREWRHGTFRPYFFDAMDRYCDVAGWRR